MHREVCNEASLALICSLARTLSVFRDADRGARVVRYSWEYLSNLQIYEEGEPEEREEVQSMDRANSCRRRMSKTDRRCILQAYIGSFGLMHMYSSLSMTNRQVTSTTHLLFIENIRLQCNAKWLVSKYKAASLTQQEIKQECFHFPLYLEATHCTWHALHGWDNCSSLWISSIFFCLIKSFRTVCHTQNSRYHTRISHFYEQGPMYDSQYTYAWKITGFSIQCLWLVAQIL